MWQGLHVQLHPSKWEDWYVVPFFVLLVNWQKISENFCYTYSTKCHQSSCHVVVNWQKIAGTFSYIYLTTFHQVYLFLNNKKYLKLFVIYIYIYLFNNMLSISVWILYLSSEQYLKIFVVFVRQNGVNFSVFLVDQWKMSQTFCSTYLTKNFFSFSIMLVEWQKIPGKSCYFYVKTFHQFMCMCIWPTKNIWKFLLYLFNKMSLIFLSS